MIVNVAGFHTEDSDEAEIELEKEWWFSDYFAYHLEKVSNDLNEAFNQAHTDLTHHFTKATQDLHTHFTAAKVLSN